MSRLVLLVSRSLALIAFSVLAVIASTVQAEQLELSPASVIGGSGSWNTNDWNFGQFQAGYVADNQEQDEIDEADQSPGDDNGGYWLGKESDEEEFFVLDLGQSYRIDQIDLYNTHNAQFDDRGTNGYEIFGGNEVGPNEDADFEAGGEDIVDAALIAAGEMELPEGIDDPLLPQTVIPTENGPFRYIRFSTIGPFHESPPAILEQRSVGINEIRVFGGIGGGTTLQAGDADEDFDFDQLDLVRVQVAAKYLSGQSASWGEGDWDGAPGGEPGNPPAGDGVFNQLGIIQALNAGFYLTGPYNAVSPGGAANDAQTSIGYDASTGEVFVDAPAGIQLTSINIDSAGSIFTGDAAANLGGSFDNDADNNIFKATFGSSFGSISFGNIAQSGLSQDFLLNDLTVVGSLAGGGALGDVDLIYIPEPSTILLAAMAILGFALSAGRHTLCLRPPFRS